MGVEGSLFRFITPDSIGITGMVFSLHCKQHIDGDFHHQNYPCTLKVRPLAVFLSFSSFSGLALLSTVEGFQHGKL